MRSTFKHTLAATALTSAVALPVATVALAQPAEPSPVGATAASALPPLSAQAHTDLLAERDERRDVVERVIAARERKAEKRAAARRAQAREEAAQRAAARAAERRAAERAEARAAERRAEEQAAEQAASERSSARASRGDSRTSLPAASGSPRTIARSMLAARGQADEFDCLDNLWAKESGWSVTAENASSGAYGIPQSLPASKMASAGSDWRTSARTQISWGLSYIADRYGSPCAAWSHSQSNDWY